MATSNVWDKAAVAAYCKRTGTRLPEGIDDPEVPREPKANKYHNQRTEYKGRMYASKHEAERAAELDLLACGGEIVAYFQQVNFTLPGGIVYRADFVILNWDGTFTIEDSKGVLTKEYRLKKRLMAAKGLTITEV